MSAQAAPQQSMKLSPQQRPLLPVSVDSSKPVRAQEITQASISSAMHSIAPRPAHAPPPERRPSSSLPTAYSAASGGTAAHCLHLEAVDVKKGIVKQQRQRAEHQQRTQQRGGARYRAPDKGKALAQRPLVLHLHLQSASLPCCRSGAQMRAFLII